MPELKSLLKNKRLVLFVGAGVSKREPSRCIEWDEMCSDMIDIFLNQCRIQITALDGPGRLGFSPERVNELRTELIEFEIMLREGKLSRDRSDNGNRSDNISVVTSILNVIKKLSKKRLGFGNEMPFDIFDKKFKEWFIGKFNPLIFNDNHKFIVQTPYAHILTTNYDTLLESAADATGVAIGSYSFHSPAETIAMHLYCNIPCIIHMHGIYSEVSPEKIVFSAGDYDRLLRRTYPGFRMAIQAMFMQYSVLFVGYGGKDPHIEDVLSEDSFLWNRMDSERPQHYMLVKASDVCPFKRQSVLSRGMKLIESDNIGEDCTRLLEMLQS